MPQCLLSGVTALRDRISSGGWSRAPPWRLCDYIRPRLADNLEHVLPELVRFRLPATVFLVTERVGTRGAFWPDELSRNLPQLSLRERRDLLVKIGLAGGWVIAIVHQRLEGPSSQVLESSLSRLRQFGTLRLDPGTSDVELLDWDDVERRTRAGIAFESHGATHAILTGLADEPAMRELRTALESLRQRGYGADSLLAYPSGAHDERVQRLAGRAGYRAAVTTRRGAAGRNDDPMALPRIGLHDDVSHSPAEFLYLVPGSRRLAAGFEIRAI